MNDKEKTYQIFGKYTLSEEELKEKSSDMAEALNELQIKEDEKKSVTSQLAAEIAELNSRARKLGGHIRDGFEMRLMTCTCEKDFIERKKHFRSVDTGEIIKTERITSEDMQLEMQE